MDIFVQYMQANLHRTLFSVAIFVACHITYRFFAREITALKNQKKLEEHIAFTVIRLGKWVPSIVVFSALPSQCDITLGMLSAVAA